MGTRCCKDMASSDYPSSLPASHQSTYIRNKIPSSAALEVQLRSVDFQSTNLSTESNSPSRLHLTVTRPAPAEDDPSIDIKLYSQKLYDMGMAFERGLKGVDKEPSRAFEHLRRAALLGHHEAQYRVGLYYERGIAVSENAQQAFQWYLKASESSANAQFSLGICYSKGIGVEKSDQQALFWLETAGKNGCDLALSSLGYFFEVGVCCERDLAKSRLYYEKSAELGNVFASQRLTMLLKENDFVEDLEDEVDQNGKLSDESMEA